MSAGDAILLDGADDVATVLRAISSGETVSVTGPSGDVQVVAKEAIPIFHKIAIKPLLPGTDVFKYGEPIGTVVTAVGKGALVHTHNLRSKRAAEA
ncbi:MAG: UxaA family hydrolase [Geminicoccaceae bacterium]